MMPAGARFVRAVAILVASALSGTISLGAQGDPLADARRLYEAAAYEGRALGAGANCARHAGRAGRTRPPMLRALALLALEARSRTHGRSERRRGRIPLFVLDESAAAPRVRDFFAECSARARAR